MALKLPFLRLITIHLFDSLAREGDCQSREVVDPFKGDPPGPPSDAV